MTGRNIYFNGFADLIIISFIFILYACFVSLFLLNLSRKNCKAIDSYRRVTPLKLLLPKKLSDKIRSNQCYYCYTLYSIAYFLLQQ